MSDVAEILFGREKVEGCGIVVAGTNNLEFEHLILNLFDEIMYLNQQGIYHTYLGKKECKEYPIMFNVYGAPAMADAVTEMGESGLRNLIFVGYAYGGFSDLEVGSVVVPTRAHHFDGFFSTIDSERRCSYPDLNLRRMLKGVLGQEDIDFYEGVNISVPSVYFQSKHDNEEYAKLKPLTLEMELATCLSVSEIVGVRSAAALVISDNRESRLGDKHEKRMQSKFYVLKAVIENLDRFNLESLDMERLSIRERLAEIIHDPNDSRNVYG